MMHSQVRSRLSAYLEGELSGREESALEAHLAECPACSAELRALRRAVDLLHNLAAPEPRSDIGGAVLERLRAGEGAPSGIARFTRGFRAPLVRIAPFALAAGIGAVAYFTPIEEPPAVVAASPAPMRAVPIAETASTAAVPGIGNGTGPAPAPRLASRMTVLPFKACLDRFRTGRPAGADCAAWEAYLVSLAMEDALRFSSEVGSLPKRHQQAVMDRVTRVAALSGSGPTLGTSFRHSRDPRMVRFAPRLERQGAPLRYVAWDGR